MTYPAPKQTGLPVTPFSRFLILEGPDGAGKTTTLQAIEKLAPSFGFKQTVSYREPGGTDLGERIRAVLKSDINIASSEAELCLFLASRYEGHSRLVAEFGDKREGVLILIDRGFLSTEAYQAAAGTRFNDRKILRGPLFDCTTFTHRKQSMIAVLDAADSLLDARLCTRNAARDRYEKDAAKIRKVREYYRSNKKNWQPTLEGARIRSFHIGSRDMPAENIADMILCQLLED